MIQYVLHYFILGSLLLAILFPQNSFAQTLNKDSLTTQTAVPDSTVAAVMAAADSLPVPGMELPAFKPNPAKAVIYSAIFPGLGQIYNRKYWKLPLVYGAFMGCAYAISWNNRNYSDYSQAYMDIMSEDPETNNSWINFLPANADPEQYIEDTNFKESLKSRKDYFRRYRDLSIIITVGVYFITMIDAYVDAQLFDFDISQDLSLRLELTLKNPTSYI